MRIHYMRVKAELLCKYKCFVDCGCDDLLKVFELLHSLDANERELLRFELCPTCPAPLPGQPGPGAPHTPPAPPQFTDCKARFRATFCSPERRGRAALILGLMRGLKVATGETLEPSISYVIDGLEKYGRWCTAMENADDADYVAALGAFCVLYDLVSNSGTATFWVMAGPAGAAILTALQSFLAGNDSVQLLAECCSTVTLPAGVNGGTATIPTPPSGTPMPPSPQPGGPVVVAGVPLPQIPGFGGITPSTTPISTIAQIAGQRTQLGPQTTTATVVAQRAGGGSVPLSLRQASNLIRIRSL
jgi:hypothetical protein